MVAVYPMCSNFKYSLHYCTFLFTRWFDSPEICCEASGNNISIGLIVNYVLRRTGVK